MTFEQVMCRAVVSLLATMSVVGCGHSEAAAPEVETAGGPTSQSGSPAEETDSAESDQADDLTPAQHMARHFQLIGAARDAVVDGHLAQSRESLQRLADGEYGMATPEAWMVWLNDMQLDANRGARAKNLQRAGRAVAQVARHCGECHSAHRDRPGYKEVPKMELPAPLDMKDRMARHLHASTLLWHGLTTPSHATWIAGAEALTDSWVASPVDVTGEQPAPDPELEKKAMTISAMGQDLREAQTPLARAEAYGDLIAACGSCHAERRN